MNVKISPDSFSYAESLLVESNGLTATTFRYPNGICAVKIKNSRGSFTVLPFHGQQIWRADFDGKDLTMNSTFQTPEDTDIFLENYGALMIHCGLTAMGNPSPVDVHPLHGELPNCKFQSAHIICGDENNVDYIGIKGTYRYRKGLSVDYEFSPEIKLFQDGTVLNMDISITNNRLNVLEYMYMCHINFKAIDKSTFIYSAEMNSREFYKGKFMRLNQSEQNNLDLFVDKLSKNPDSGDILNFAEQNYNPEVCSVSKYKKDAQGFAHAIQKLPDNTSWYVSFDTDLLPNALRWISITGDEEASGFALPTTSNHLGYTYAKTNDLLRKLNSKETEHIKIKFGYLDKISTSVMERQITSILNS